MLDVKGMLSIVSIIFIVVSCTSKQNVINDEEARTICNKLEEIYSNKNIENISDVLDSNYVLYSPFLKTGARGLEVTTYNIQSNSRSFPDYSFKIDSFYVVDNNLFYFWNATGTNTNLLGRMPSTGKSIDINGLTVAKVKNGKIYEEHQFWNTMEFYTQLGFQIIPPQTEK